MSHQADSNGFRHESKTESKVLYPANYVTFLSFEFCSVMQLKNYTGTSQLSVVKLTLNLYYAQCISFSRLKKALNILNFSCLPDASLLSTLRVLGA
jgi:hypothetical protein